MINNDISNLLWHRINQIFIYFEINISTQHYIKLFDYCYKFIITLLQTLSWTNIYKFLDINLVNFLTINTETLLPANLYADDLVLVGKCEEELIEKLRKWNECLKDKGLKINEEKTKVMCESFGTGTTQVIGDVKHPCSVCLKDVGVNSIRCTQCTMGSYKVQQSERLS